MAPPARRMVLSCFPAFLLGLVCLLARASVFAPALNKTLSENRGSDARALFAHLPAQAWAAFAAGVNQPVGFLVIGELCFLLLTYVLMGTLESSRVRARWGPLEAVPLLQLLPAAFLGASASFAMVWLPSYLRARAPRRSSSGNAINLHRWGHCVSITFAVFYVCQQAISLAHETVWVGRAINYFCNYVITMSINFCIYCLKFGPPSFRTTMLGQLERTARICYLAAAALSALWRALTFVLLYHDPKLLSQALSLLTSRGFADTSEAAVWFFMVDLIGFALSFAYFVLLEDGPWVALCTGIGALVLGPATAFAFYCAYRENQIEKALASVPQPEQVAKAA